MTSTASTAVFSRRPDPVSWLLVVAETIGVVLGTVALFAMAAGGVDA